MGGVRLEIYIYIYIYIYIFYVSSEALPTLKCLDTSMRRAMIPIVTTFDQF